MLLEDGSPANETPAEQHDNVPKEVGHVAFSTHAIGPQVYLTATDAGRLPGGRLAAAALGPGKVGGQRPPGCPSLGP